MYPKQCMKESKKGYPIDIVDHFLSIALQAQGEANDDRIDFIDLFLDAESNEFVQETTGVYDKSNAQVNKTFIFFKVYKPLQVSKRLTIDEVIAQCNIFLIAGFDTTVISTLFTHCNYSINFQANTLALTCHYLSKHPEIQERLRDEINEVCVNAVFNYKQRL